MKFSTIITYLTLQTFTYINDSSAAAAGFQERLQETKGDTNRFIVKFKDRSRFTGLAVRRRSHRPDVKKVMDLPDDNMEVMYFSNKEYGVKYWEQQEDVEYVVPDHKVYLFAESVPWGITAVQALEVSDDAVSNQKVCIIDTGYDITHPDLQDETSIVSGTSQITSQSWTEDGNGHGTHVAGTIAGIGGNDQGVVGVIRNGEVKLHIVKIFDNDGAWTYSSNLIEAVENCAAEGSTVVNMSLGSSYFSQAEDDAFTRIYNQGVLLVAAAGNDGDGGKSYPASYSSVMSVAAVDQNNDRAYFSQYNDEVDIAAPGVDILSTIPGGGYASFQGTSMACPVVAGVAALVWSHFPTKSAQEIRDALESTAEDLGPTGRDDSFGHGLVQAHLAYNCLAGGDCSSGTVDATCETSPVGWYDSDGPSYDCGWYAEDYNCEKYGDFYTNFDATANQACCVCGGGKSTVTCEDSVGTSPGEWYDSDGPFYSCSWYAQDDNCEIDGDNYDNFGLTANQACCACGGGTSVGNANDNQTGNGTTGSTTNDSFFTSVEKSTF